EQLDIDWGELPSMKRTFLAAVAGSLFCPLLFAQDTSSAPSQSADGQKGDDKATGDLQEAVQNPVASLISVPLQNNTGFDIGPFDRNQNVLNIQPVIPIRVSENWNLIIRWIVPIIWQPAPGTANLQVFGIVENTPAYLAAQDVRKSAGVFGFGDMTPTFFLPPATPHKLSWVVAPYSVLPTATSKVLGQKNSLHGQRLLTGLIRPKRAWYW